jgi:hypothetical protein
LRSEKGERQDNVTVRAGRNSEPESSEEAQETALASHAPILVGAARMVGAAA